MQIHRCPACDWKTIVKKNESENLTYFFVQCADCRLSQKQNKYTKEEDAIAAWNDSCGKLQEN
jgi:hypothetical protein